MKKYLLMGIIAAVFTLNTTIVAFAGTWQQDVNGWWYDNGDGTWSEIGWQWIDGNYDGTAECYYFNQQGYCLTGTVTPDGYLVNESGAWVQNGIVQTQNMNQKNGQENRTVLSERQRGIMQKVLSGVISLEPSFLPLEADDLSDDDMIQLLYGHLNNELYYDPFGDNSCLLFDDYSVVSGLDIKRFDKYEVLERMEDLYGYKMNENMLNPKWFQVEGNYIFIDGADGDGMTDSRIIDYKLEDGKLYLSVYYTVTFAVSDLDTDGEAFAVFRVNPDSFIGFTLESVNIK